MKRQKSGLSIPYDQISTPQNLSHLPADKMQRSGSIAVENHMSEIAAEELVSLRYSKIWNLTGGMVDWEQAVYEIEKKQN